MTRFSLPVLVIGVVLLTGCTHRAARTEVPPPPNIEPANPSAAATTPAPSTQPTRPNYPSQEDVTLGAGHAVYVETGIASWYGPPYHNRRAANGEIYDMNALTAAHRTLPLGTMVRVTNLENHRSVIVRINDRGPFAYKRIIDLSPAAARALGIRDQGLMRVRIEKVSEEAAVR